MFHTPLRLLLQFFTSADITELMAYKRRNTFFPDVWFAAMQGAYTTAGYPPDKFLPTDDDGAADRRRRNTAAAEARMDQNS